VRLFFRNTRRALARRLFFKIYADDYPALHGVFEKLGPYASAFKRYHKFREEEEF
jgi:hypothetical protein